ncbi:36.4 kDa proline-rich protein-like [Pygocentrus nattereri]|uniref:36.4 kDa proline-rich protein-like n=1 Tax=Pygocentrus nattereri TaxID=42514 RepID=UPI001890B67E|nr:36.4 kDa proline-rich protein-like [Pygocentrus nattereri]
MPDDPEIPVEICVECEKKPLPQGPPGGILGILGVVVVAGLIVGVVVTICMVYKRGQKPRTETDNDLIAVADSCVTQTQAPVAEAPEKPESPSRTDLPPAHKPAPPPPKKKTSDMKGGLTSDDIQVVHLDKEDEMQKLPLQPPYYDMAPSESTAFTDKPNSGNRFEELPNPADYVNYHHPGSQEHCIEIQPPSAYPPVTFLPQNPYTQHPTNTPMYTFQPNAAPPAPRPPYTFPKEQSV